RPASSGCYAVLAQVSPGYPPLEGRLATCYSPVRHFTHLNVLLHPDFLVRLACVRHAASVDSEPGSNSRLKLVSPADFAAPELPIGSGEFSPALYRPSGRLYFSLRALTCEFSSRFKIRKENIVPPLILNCTVQGLPKGQNVSLSIWTEILKGLSPIDVACSTQLSKSFVSRRRRGPPIGEGWKARATGFSCLPRWSFQHL